MVNPMQSFHCACAMSSWTEIQSAAADGQISTKNVMTRTGKVRPTTNFLSFIADIEKKITMLQVYDLAL